MTNTSLKNQFKKYFGIHSGGIDLLSSFNNLNMNDMSRLKDAIQNCQGRIFFMGNGGSYDNARWMAQRCRALGFKAKTPGVEEDYILTLSSSSYENIFINGLQFDSLNNQDLVIAISGSGNSANIIKALDYSTSKGAESFALGGRDGGQMAKVLPLGNCIIASSQSMEAIEDLHNLVFISILDSITAKISLEQSLRQTENLLKNFLREENISEMDTIAQGMLSTIKNNGHTFILGLGIGANHFRADMGRGATNAMPIRGLSTPEVFSMNSLQATSNDDGSHYILADGLIKLSPTPHDFAILCGFDEDENQLSPCREILESRGTPYIQIGKGHISFTPFKQKDNDFIIAMIGHACGHVLHEFLSDIYKIRPLEVNIDFEEGQKKMGRNDTLTLEKELRSKGLLEKEEVITFCYGSTYAVKSSTNFERVYF